MLRAISRLLRRHAHVAAAPALLALAGCGPSNDKTVHVLVIGDPQTPFATGGRLPVAAQLLRAATVEGLVGFDAQGRIIPALADRWIVTDDGQSYIFRLRDGSWPDGTPISGETARQSLRQAIAGLRGTALALDLGAIDDIRAMAGRVVEIRLSQPMPDLLQVLAQPELGLTRRGRGAGPMELKRDGAVAVLTPIPPESRGLPAMRGWSDRALNLRLSAAPAATAIARFDKGEADIVLGGRIEQFPRASQAGLTRGAIRMDAVSGLFGLLVLRDDGFLASSDNREALAMAIDRERLLSAFGISGWVPTTRIVSPGTEGDSGGVTERWTEMTLAQRHSMAAERVARWRAANGDAAPRLRVALPRGPGADLLLARLEHDLGGIGITLERVAENNAAADLRLVDVSARYPRISWFLNQLSCAVLRGPCSTAADARVAAARHATEPAGRIALLAQAEAELAGANVFIPFGTPVRWSLVGGDASGFSINRWGFHPLMPMAMRPK